MRTKGRVIAAFVRFYMIEILPIRLLLRRKHRRHWFWFGGNRSHSRLGLNCHWIWIALRNHHVEASLPSLFFRLDHILLLHLSQIVRNPFMLLARETAFGDVNRSSRKVGRCNLALRRRRIMVMTHQLALLLRRAYRRVDFDGPMKFLVELPAQIIDELCGPRACISAILFERWVQDQVLRFLNWHEYATFLELLKLNIVFDALQTGLVNLRILLEQRVA